MSEYIPPKCKYWTLEIFCVYWDVENTVCTYYDYVSKEDDDQGPTHYPFCNLMGSESRCTRFSATPKKKDEGDKRPGIPPAYRCSLIDPNNSVGNYTSSTYWAYMTIDEKGDLILDTSLITGYREKGFFCKWSQLTSKDTTCADNLCGTNIECSGYNSSHMGFTVLAPNMAEDQERFKTFTLPLNYKMLEIRAQLSTCYWWSRNTGFFLLHFVQNRELPFLEIQNPLGPKFDDIHFPIVVSSDVDIYTYTGSCRRWDTSDYIEFSVTNLPCIGAHDKCPYYTGVCWEYVKNDLLLYGQKVLGEQVLELRYYFHQGAWDVRYYNDIFSDPTIVSWLGNHDYVYIFNQDESVYYGNYQVVALGLTFDTTFSVSYSSYTVEFSTESLPNVDESSVTNFPTLIRDIESLLLSPVILTRLMRYEVNTSEGGSKKINLFETQEPIKPTIILLGDLHTHAYDQICINISMFEVEPTVINSLKSYGEINNVFALLYSELFGNERNSFNFFQDVIGEFVHDVRIFDKDKISEDKAGLYGSSFYFDVPLKFGYNELLVLVKYRSQKLDTFYWGFAFYTVFCKYTGAFLKQTQFVLSKNDTNKNEFGEHKIADRLFDYRRAFFALETTAEVEVVDLVNKEVPFPEPEINIEDLFNDYFSTDLLDSSVSYVGCHTYRLYREYHLDYTHITQVGSGGYVLVNLPEDTAELITSAYAPIEIKDEGGYLFLEYKISEEQIQVCNMEVVAKSVRDGLLDNQLLLRPKNISYFRSICKDTKLYIGYFAFKVKKNKEFSLPQGTAFTIEEVTKGNILAAFTPDVLSGNKLIIKGIRGTVNLAVPLRGVSGAVVSISRIKLVTWVQQPTVPDIEIFYRWLADYGVYRNYPICTCCGEYHRTLIDEVKISNIPECGDHEVNPMTAKGPMWYPYVQCLPYSRYNKINNQIYGDLMETKGLYKEVDDDGARVHGSWDMRMEGPVINTFRTGTYCCSICACSCSVETFNVTRLSGSDSYFSGFARYRGGVSLDTLVLWLNTGGGLPRFGNTTRPRLESYRATDYVQFLYLDYTTSTPKYSTKWMWMPTNMFFSDSNYMLEEDVLYDNFLETKGVGIINGLGTMLFTSVDGELLAENILEERFRFEDVFEVYRSLPKIAYPKPVGDYAQKDILVPQFKTLPNGPIQWAWREVYKDIERDYDGKGGLLFVSLGKLPYKFDKFGMEHRLVTDEGKIKLKFIAPTLDNRTGLYFFPGRPLLQLGSGPKRYLSWEGGFESRYYYDVNYTEYTTHPWENVDLFDSDYVLSTAEAKQKGREIIREGDTGQEVATYYNRGIKVDWVTFPDSSVVPTILKAINIRDVTFELSDSSDTKLATNLDVHFAAYKAVSRMTLTFDFGVELDVTKSDEETNFYNIYVIPDIEVESHYKTDFIIPKNMDFGTKTVKLDYSIPIYYLVYRGLDLNIKFSFEVPKYAGGRNKIPPQIPIDPAKTTVCAYKIRFIKEKSLFYDTVIADKEELIYVHERKYRVSVAGNNSLVPPHGNNVGKNVLKPRFDKYELDTVWQRDRDGEVVDLPGSSGEVKYTHKTRTSILQEAIKDLQPVEGDVHTAEKEQSRIYNRLIDKADSFINYDSIIYPTLEDVFDKLGVRPRGATAQGSMENTSLFRAGTPINYPKMNPQGHLLLPSPPWHETCSIWTRNREGCSGDDTFGYVVYYMDDNSTKSSSYTGLDIFYSGTLFLIQRLKIAKFLATVGGAKYDVSSRGKVFEEGDAVASLLPAYEPMPGLYATNNWYYTTRKPRSRWPHIIPALWQIFGKLEDYVP